MSRFSRLSMFHANSPISCAPTMRPLPFSVWNERRVLIKASEFVRSAVHSGRLRWILAISSLASSMNTSTSSGSERSSSTCMTLGGGAAGFFAAGGGGAAAAG